MESKKSDGLTTYRDKDIKYMTSTKWLVEIYNDRAYSEFSLCLFCTTEYISNQAEYFPPTLQISPFQVLKLLLYSPAQRNATFILHYSFFD